MIVILMSLCVIGIVGLQLFWTYQNYHSTVKAFDQDGKQKSSSVSVFDKRELPLR